MLKAAFYFVIVGSALPSAPSAIAQMTPDTITAKAPTHEMSSEAMQQKKPQSADMDRLAFLDGIWRGTAWTLTPNGKHEIIQTERIGSFLQGNIKVIEGRGYEHSGAVSFNALGVISYNSATQSYSISSWALGQQGVFPFHVRADGYDWEVPAGPGASIKYSATIVNGEFVEVGHHVAGSAAPIKIFEMRLRRVGNTTWPVGDAVPMR